MAGIKGELCVNATDLRRVASKRKKPFLEKSLSPDELELSLSEGWELIRKTKRKFRVRKPKPKDVLFEDRLWMVFYGLGFKHLNKDRSCVLEFDTYSKKIDILARDEENIFVVECKSTETDGPVNAKDALEEYVGKREEIQKAIEKEWGRGCGRINLVIAVSSLDKREIDETYVNEKKDKNIFLWSAKEINYIEQLIKQVGTSAKYQLYSVIFANRRNKHLKAECPAIKGRIGGNTFYSFLIEAKKLLKYAYVHHRDLTGIVEASQVYQRMLKNTKLKEIGDFIDNEDGYFPNSIIVNFSKDLNWERRASFDNNVSMGTITLPEYYGCAWIIDGQHRLYGAARARKDVLIPVLAFEKIKALEQANLFVEINEKQTSVPKNLLWDLYSDIYRDSDDPKQQIQFQIAETAKTMGQSGPLSEYIDFPSRPSQSSTKISLTTICSTIELYSPWDKLKHPTDPSKTPENAARLINTYFEALKNLWPEDWQKGHDGVLLTNNGFGVFMMVFQDIVRFLPLKKQEGLLRPNRANEFKKELCEKYLKQIVLDLKNDIKVQNEIKQLAGRGPQKIQAGWLELSIRKAVHDFTSPRLEDSPPPIIPKEQRDPLITIEEKARLAEKFLRDFILTSLKRNYGTERWWKLGLTGGTKKKADDAWIKEVDRKPWLKKDDDANETKFGFLTSGDMIEIIVYGDNWEQIFEAVFNNKENVIRRINDINALRNPSTHKRSLDDQDVLDGLSGLLWLSNCISVPDINPNFSSYESISNQN